MQLDFEIGDSSHPSGHALIYFRDTAASDSIGVTYIVILPVPLDIAKYMPPFMAGQVAELSSGDISSFAFPPAPEQVGGYDSIRRTAETRGDDLIFGGTLALSDVFESMERVSEATSEYSKIYHDAYGNPADDEATFDLDEEDDGIEDSLHDLMYGGMSEADLLAELTSQLGRMRYAIEGRDVSTASEARSRLRAISRYLPENREVSKLIAAASSEHARASELAQLYLERAYCLYREDYLRLKSLDSQIANMLSNG